MDNQGTDAQDIRQPAIPQGHKKPSSLACAYCLDSHEEASKNCSIEEAAEVQFLLTSGPQDRDAVI